MPLVIPCPSCNARLKAPENLIGKTVKCPNCQTPIAVKAPSHTPAPPARQTAPAKQTAPVKPRKPAPEPEEDFEEFDERPAPRKPPRKVARGEDEDFDEAPPPRKGKGKVARDDDDFTDAPPPRKGKSKPPPEPEEEYDDLDEDEDQPRKGKGKGKGKKAGVALPSGPTNDDDRTWGMLLWLSGYVLGIFGPILIYFMKKDSKFILFNVKMFFNSMITGFCYILGLGLLLGGLTVGLMFIDTSLIFIGMILMFLVLVPLALYFNALVPLLSALKAKNGTWYKAPLVWYLIK
jgi:uncharacterized Tic20 family protein